MLKYISGFFLIFGSFALGLSCTNSEIHTNVANQVESVIDEIYADTSNFRSKNIFTVEHYQLTSDQNKVILINNRTRLYLEQQQ